MEVVKFEVWSESAVRRMSVVEAESRREAQKKFYAGEVLDTWDESEDATPTIIDIWEKEE